MKQMETTLQIKSVQTLKKERENKLSELFKSVQLFFAFSEKQFLEGKPELKEGDKILNWCRWLFAKIKY